MTSNGPLSATCSLLELQQVIVDLLQREKVTCFFDPQKCTRRPNSMLQVTVENSGSFNWEEEAVDIQKWWEEFPHAPLEKPEDTVHIWNLSDHPITIHTRTVRQQFSFILDIHSNILSSRMTRETHFLKRELQPSMCMDVPKEDLLLIIWNTFQTVIHRTTVHINAVSTFRM